MKIGIAIEETWDFLHEIYADLCQHHQVSLFKRRTSRLPIFRERSDRALFQHDLSQLLTQNDAVFFEWASHLLTAATQLPKTCGIVTRVHRYEMYQWVDRVDWNKVDRIILVSKAKQAEFIERFPEQAEKTVLIYEAVSLDKFTFQPKPYSGDIGILCHLTPRKRVYELIVDFYGLIQQDSSFHLHIGGDPHPSHGDYYFAMRDIVKQLGIQDRVTFYGMVKDTWNWYHNIDIIISNGYSEGLQVSPIEAMASGCYCLSHHWAGADELLPSENLYYTGRELQEKILNFAALTEPEKLAQKNLMLDLAKNKFNVDDTKERVRQVIEQAGDKLHHLPRSKQ